MIGVVSIVLGAAKSLIVPIIQKLIKSKLLAKIPLWGYAILIVLIFSFWQHWKISRLESKNIELSKALENNKQTVEHYQSQAIKNAELVIERNEAQRQVIESLQAKNKDCAKLTEHYKLIAKQNKETNSNILAEYETFKIEASKRNSCYNEPIPSWLLK